MFTHFLLLILIWIISRAIWRRLKYDLHKIPSTPSLPILGHTLEFANQGKNFSEWFQKRHKEMGFPVISKVMSSNEKP